MSSNISNKFRNKINKNNLNDTQNYNNNNNNNNINNSIFKNTLNDFMNNNAKIRTFQSLNSSDLLLSEVQNLSKVNDFFKIEEKFCIDKTKNKEKYVIASIKNENFNDSYFNSPTSKLIYN